MPDKFYITIDRDMLKSGKLIPPRSFARSHMHEISTMMVLSLPIPRLPKDLIWELEVEWNKDGLFWLLGEEGWSEFSAFYLLKEGDVLLFSYNKVDSEFYVVICDDTQTEINYPTEEIVSGPSTRKLEFYCYVKVDKEIVESKKITMPMSFSRKYRHEIKPIANLFLRNSLIWEMVVDPDGAVLSFEAEEFVNLYSLTEGLLLVFCYCGNTCFMVTIFDQNRSEIDYPRQKHAHLRYAQLESSTAGKRKRTVDQSCSQSPSVSASN